MKYPSSLSESGLWFVQMGDAFSVVNMDHLELKQYVSTFMSENKYSLIQMKCQGSNKYALSITVKFDQSTRRFGRISFARLFKLTKHIALLFYLLSAYFMSCMRGSRNVRKNMHIIKMIMEFCVH